MPLTELEDYVITNKHLPDVPTAQDVDTNGIPVGDLSVILLKKVEELTLYTIDQQKNINELKQIVEQQQQMIQQLIDNQNNN
ncbi:MAG: hypothetical protein JXR68_10020 [Bacteroidales bacterium]|nr:hypothetical protein [Bacteroidales bacterium]